MLRKAWKGDRIYNVRPVKARQLLHCQIQVLQPGVSFRANVRYSTRDQKALEMFEVRRDLVDEAQKFRRHDIGPCSVAHGRVVADLIRLLAYLALGKGVVTIRADTASGVMPRSKSLAKVYLLHLRRE